MAHLQSESHAPILSLNLNQHAACKLPCPSAYPGDGVHIQIAFQIIFLMFLMVLSATDINCRTRCGLSRMSLDPFGGGHLVGTSWWSSAWQTPLVQQAGSCLCIVTPIPACVLPRMQCPTVPNSNVRLMETDGDGYEDGQHLNAATPVIPRPDTSLQHYRTVQVSAFKNLLTASIERTLTSIIAHKRVDQVTAIMAFHHRQAGRQLQHTYSRPQCPHKYRWPAKADHQRQNPEFYGKLLQLSYCTA